MSAADTKAPPRLHARATIPVVAPNLPPHYAPAQEEHVCWFLDFLAYGAEAAGEMHPGAYS